MPAIMDQGKSIIRDSIKGAVTHVAVSDDSTAFSTAHTGINPAGNKSVLVEASTDANNGIAAFDASITISGTTEFTNKTIWSIGVAKGVAVMQNPIGTGTAYGAPTEGNDLISRSVRSQGIGVQAGDEFTISVRVTVEDNT